MILKFNYFSTAQIKNQQYLDTFKTFLVLCDWSSLIFSVSKQKLVIKYIGTQIFSKTGGDK